MLKLNKLRNLPRTRFLSFLAIAFAVVLIGKLYFLQVVNGDEFKLRADRQYTTSAELVFDRGSIFFEDKNNVRISAATLKSGFTISINPKILKNPEDAYNKLSQVIEINKDDFFLKAGMTNDPYEEIAKQVEEISAKKIKDLNIDGVSVNKNRWRFYPAGELANRVIGFVAFQENELAGRYGAESFYEDVLGRKKGDVYINFFAEVFSNINDSLIKHDLRKEGDVVLTIEPHVQNFLEGKILEIKNKWNAKETYGVIINPIDGSIYSMAVQPGFNLNNFSEQKDVSIFSNPLVENVFEMGSIIKPLTISAGIDAGVITAKTKYKDDGYIILDEKKISNYDKKGRGEVNMQEVLNQSLNTGAAFVAGKLGNKKFADYVYKFGLGEESGIDLPNEAANLVENLESPRDLEYATASFGQGIAFTPVATIRALSALANGGTLITPHIAKKIEYKVGFSKKIKGENLGLRAIRKETSDEITRMLVKVVDEALLGGTVKMERYTIAAKTGTAEIADPEHGGYYEDRYLHAFFGYFPAYNPQFLIFLMAREPQGAKYASNTLTQPFMDTVKFLINYYQIPPDR